LDDGKLFKLVGNVEDGLSLFYSVSSFFTELHSQEKPNFPDEWLPCINMTYSKMLSDLSNSGFWLSFFAQYVRWILMRLWNIIAILRKKDKVLLLEYASFVERVRVKTEESQNKVLSSG
jgi:hypothetical protein